MKGCERSYTDLLVGAEGSSDMDPAFFNLRLEIPIWAMYWLMKERPLVEGAGMWERERRRGKVMTGYMSKQGVKNIDTIDPQHQQAWHLTVPTTERHGQRPWAGLEREKWSSNYCKRGRQEWFVAALCLSWIDSKGLWHEEYGEEKMSSPCIKKIQIKEYIYYSIKKLLNKLQPKSKLHVACKIKQVIHNNFSLLLLLA